MGPTLPERPDTLARPLIYFWYFPRILVYTKTVNAEMSPYLVPQKEIPDVPPINDSPYFSASVLFLSTVLRSRPTTKVAALGSQINFKLKAENDPPDLPKTICGAVRS